MAGLIIMAHGVIPHHHHYDSVYSHADYHPCTASHEHEHDHEKKKEHEEDGGQHCHAFNESKVDRVKTIKISFQSVAKLFETIFILPEFSGTSKGNYFVYHFTHNIFPYFLYIYTEFPLRAPPSLS